MHTHSTFVLLVLLTLVANGSGAVNPAPSPPSAANGVIVGGGFVESYSHQIVRTTNNVVYIITADDNPCQHGGSGVIRAWKGTGAQPDNQAVPTGFSEQDVLNHPVSAGNGSCAFQSGVTAMLLGPDSRLDPAGIIHVAYIDGNTGNLYYQTFSTLTDSWGSRVVIASGTQTDSGTGWPRTGQVALTLDFNHNPFVTFASSGAANAIRYTTRSGGAWRTPSVVSSGSNVMHPTMVTAFRQVAINTRLAV
jgi:hypothetical protein